MPRSPSLLPAVLAVVAAACSNGPSSTPIGGATVTPEVLACRLRVDNPNNYSEIAVRNAGNLGLQRVADRYGRELHVRLHPDANTVVFARERNYGEPATRDLYTSTVDGARGERRLTSDNVRDDEPCWSPDGTVLLFTSERGGGASLWACNADGSGAHAFLTPPAGSRDGEADWCRTTGRVVFVRRDAAGHCRLWLVWGDGTGDVPLTDGGPGTAAGAGDHEPAFAPDGTKVAFVRRLAEGTGSLFSVDVATGAVTMLCQSLGDAALPRWSPHADRVLFGIAEPAVGRATMRLASVPAAGGSALLLWPDQRWQLDGLDLSPVLPAAPATVAPRVLDVTRAAVEVAAGNAQPGSKSLLSAQDGSELGITTAWNGTHEVAGINCRFDLPVTAATDVVELRVRVVARVGRIGGDSALRLSIYNPVDQRFDIVWEHAPVSTDAHTMTFSTGSLRHVTKEKQLRVAVIGELPEGTTSELRVDLVEVTLVARAVL